MCFDTSPPESRTSMDSSFERKSISTVASYYSISFQSSLNELVSMSSSVQRKKVSFSFQNTKISKLISCVVVYFDIALIDIWLPISF